MDIINRILPSNPDSGIEEEYRWNTLSSKMRGNIQTRSLSVRPERIWALSFFKLEKQEKNAILNFYNARNGGYDKFLFMPYKDVNNTYVDADTYSDIKGITGSASTATQIYLEKYAPAEDDLFINWSIEIGTTHKPVTDYDGFNKILTTPTFGAEAVASKPYTLHQKIGVGTGTAFTFNLLKNYSSYSEIKKYVYDESLWNSNGTLTPSIYAPKIWTHDGSSITTWSYDDVSGTGNTFKLTTINKFTNNYVNYFEAPLIFNTAPTSGHYITGSWYYLYPVRFHSDEAYSQNAFAGELFTLNTITLIEVIEPD